MKVNYESMVDWKLATDYLRCSPEFHGVARNDCVMVNGRSGKQFFGQLLFIFACRVQGTEFNLAHIHPFDAPIGAIHRRRDHDLKFMQLCSQPRNACLFISVESIICGAPIAIDYGKDGDYLVIDPAQSDLWLCVGQCRKQQQQVGISH
jgi:hypothetical protein